MEIHNRIELQYARVLGAAEELGTFVQAQAKAMKSFVGFGYQATPLAPSSFPELQDAYARCAATGEQLPISSLNMETAIFRRKKTNHALRFVHDVTHVRLKLGFSLEDEALVAAAHLDVLRAYGYPPNSDVYRVMVIDTMGQNRCFAEIGRFPIDQRRFAVWAFFDGIDEAIAYEDAVGPDDEPQLVA